MALGKGLSAILNDPDLQQNSKTNPASSSPVIGNVFEIPLKKFRKIRINPCTHFNEEKLRELATSIRELGVVQPITVRQLAQVNFNWLLAKDGLERPNHYNVRPFQHS